MLRRLLPSQPCTDGPAVCFGPTGKGPYIQQVAQCGVRTAAGAAWVHLGLGGDLDTFLHFFQVFAQIPSYWRGRLGPLK